MLPAYEKLGIKFRPMGASKPCSDIRTGNMLYEIHTEPVVSYSVETLEDLSNLADGLGKTLLIDFDAEVITIQDSVWNPSYTV